MMVKQTRILFDVKDLLCIRVECMTCHREEVIPMGEHPGMPVSCSNGHTLIQFSGGQPAGALKDLFHALQEAYREPVGGARLRFEIDGEESAETPAPTA